MAMGAAGAYGCSHWVGGGNTPWAGRLSVLSDWQMYSKMTNMCMSLTFIWASSQLLFWQLSSSGGFTIARSETLKTGVHCLVAELCVLMRSTTAIYSLKRFRKGPVLLANRGKVFILWNASVQFSDCDVFLLFLNIKQFDLTANYICITCYLFSFTLYKVKLKPVERLLKG